MILRLREIRGERDKKLSPRDLSRKWVLSKKEKHAGKYYRYEAKRHGSAS
jgi:hypothetical protein